MLMSPFWEFWGWNKVYYPALGSWEFWQHHVLFAVVLAMKVENVNATINNRIPAVRLMSWRV
jgi:hypothetical protein